MTQPDPLGIAASLLEVRQQVTAMAGTVGKLERTVDGDPDMGVPSLRRAVKDVADELKNEAESLCDRLDKLEQAAQMQDSALKEIPRLVEEVREVKQTIRTQEAYVKGLSAFGKWIGGGTLAGLLTLIGLVSGFIGGGK